MASKSRWRAEWPRLIGWVSAAPQVEHRVKVTEFKSWLNRTGGSPATTAHRQKVRAIFEQ